MGEGDLGGIEKDITGDEAVKQLRGLGSWIPHSMNTEITKNDGKSSGRERYSGQM